LATSLLPRSLRHAIGNLRIRIRQARSRSEKHDSGRADVIVHVLDVVLELVFMRMGAELVLYPDDDVVVRAMRMAAEAERKIDLPPLSSSHLRLDRPQSKSVESVVSGRRFRPRNFARSGRLLVWLGPDAR